MHLASKMWWPTWRHVLLYRETLFVLSNNFTDQKIGCLPLKDSWKPMLLFRWRSHRLPRAFSIVFEVTQPPISKVEEFQLTHLSLIKVVPVTPANAYSLLVHIFSCHLFFSFGSIGNNLLFSHFFKFPLNLAFYSFELLNSCKLKNKKYQSFNIHHS